MRVNIFGVIRRYMWQTDCNFSMLWWHQLRLSELGTGHSRNVICKPWVMHVWNYFGTDSSSCFCWLGPSLAWNFPYLERKNWNNKKTPWFGDLVRRCPCWCPLGRRGPGNARHHWFYHNYYFLPVSTVGQLGRCSHTRPKLVATYRWFCYVLQY